MSSLNYRVTYGSELVGNFSTLEESLNSVSVHPKFVKSKYTRKGRPRSGLEELKPFYIVDSNGSMYYIY